MATREDLRKLQSQPLDDKVQCTLGLISEWYAYWDNQCYVSFSGGKDSTVLADIAAKWCAIAGIPLDLVFVDTGLEYPDIKEHVRDFAQYLREKYDIDVQLTVLRPKMTFAEVITKYGYPMIGKQSASKICAKRRGAKWTDLYFAEADTSRYNVSKWKALCDVDFNISDKCCDVMKKSPAHTYGATTGRKAIVGTKADESLQREAKWKQYGCNAFSLKVPLSKPMSFWLEQDVLAYTKSNALPIASVYGDVVFADDPEQIRMDESFCGRMWT